MAKENEGAVVEAEELEVTEPTESQNGAYAEVGEFDETEPMEAEEEQEVTEPASEVDEPTATEEPLEPIDEPEVEVEVEEVDIPEGKKSADRAFAEMRRANEDLQAENAELRERIEALEKGNKQNELIRTATEMGLSDEEIQQVLEDAEAEEQAQRERTALEDELEGYKERLMELEAEKRMKEDLRAIQAINPDIKTIDDLPPEFLDYISAGLGGEEAYWATQARNAKEKFEGAKELGKVNSVPVERDYFTSEEIDKLSDKELDDPTIWEKVQRSLNRL